jgi:hypothetical protein
LILQDYYKQTVAVGSSMSSMLISAVKGNIPGMPPAPKAMNGGIRPLRPRDSPTGYAHEMNGDTEVLAENGTADFSNIVLVDLAGTYMLLFR